jgi:hypothetical protein
MKQRGYLAVGNRIVALCEMIENKSVESVKEIIVVENQKQNKPSKFIQKPKNNWKK